MSAPLIETIYLDSPARFAVIGAGSPAPKVIAASSESIADLIGYFSLREAGLDTIIHSANDKYKPGIIDLFVKRGISIADRYLIIDAYVTPPGGERLQLYSLIIDRSEISFAKLEPMREFAEKLEPQIARLAVSYETGNGPEAVYVSQMLATLVAFLIDRIDQEGKARERTMEIFRKFLMVYAAALGILSVLFTLDGGRLVRNIAELIVK